MDKFTPAEIVEAKEFAAFFIELLEYHKENVLFYLADTAVLDWFGRTVKGSKDIGAYLKDCVGSHKQHFDIAQPVRNIGFRETHVIKYTSKLIQHDKASLTSPNNSNEITPPQQAFTATSQTRVTEIGQGDGLQNCDTPESPLKKCKLDTGQGDSTAEQSQMKYLSMEGHVEFRRKSSKKLQRETKWNRPCKLEIAYCATTFEDCTIYMMIYQGNMKCRKNLLKDFESCEPDD